MLCAIFNVVDVQFAQILHIFTGAECKRLSLTFYLFTRQNLTICHLTNINKCSVFDSKALKSCKVLSMRPILEACDDWGGCLTSATQRGYAGGPLLLCGCLRVHL